MTTLDSSFEEAAREALLEELEHEFVGKPANLVFEFVELVHTNLRAYAQRHGYNVEPAIESIQQPEVEVSGRTITITVGWADEQMGRWEFGVSEHTIDGDPVLSFIWEDPPTWVREEFDQGRSSDGQFRSGWRVFLPEVDHPGIPESRAIRDSLNGLRRVLEA